MKQEQTITKAKLIHSANSSTIKRKEKQKSETHNPTTTHPAPDTQ